MIVNGFDGRAGKEPHPLSSRHPHKLESDGRPQSIEKEALEGVIIQCAKSIWHVKSVVAGMKRPYKSQLRPSTGNEGFIR